MVQSVADGNWYWKLNLTNLRGNVRIQVDTNCPWRPKEAKIALYEGNPPSNPTSYVWSKWFAPPDGPYDVDTGKAWGPGWSAAMIAMDDNSSDEGNYHYVVTTPVTE
jgi:hypothetical protein